jgi:hypothetical protein
VNTNGESTVAGLTGSVDVPSVVEEITDEMEPDYHSHDKEKLRAFLKQDSHLKGKTNGEQLGLTAKAVEELSKNESWTKKIRAISWTDRVPKRLAHLSLTFDLAGNLDLSGCTALTSLECSNTHLTELNVSGCTALTKLSCYNNQTALTTLNVTGCIVLTELMCDNSQLTELGVRDCAALKELNCNTNKLKTLDLRENTALTSLNCSSNQLKALDVTDNTALTSLNCTSNLLEILEITSNTKLTSLECEHNQLKTLDIAGNAKLTKFHCKDNPLAELIFGWLEPPTFENYPRNNLSLPENLPEITLRVPVGTVARGTKTFSTKELYLSVAVWKNFRVRDYPPGEFGVRVSCSNGIMSVISPYAETVGIYIHSGSTYSDELVDSFGKYPGLAIGRIRPNLRGTLIVKGESGWCRDVPVQNPR